MKPSLEMFNYTLITVYSILLGVGGFNSTFARLFRACRNRQLKGIDISGLANFRGFTATETSPKPRRRTDFTRKIFAYLKRTMIGFWEVCTLLDIDSEGLQNDFSNMPENSINVSWAFLT